MIIKKIVILTSLLISLNLTSKEFDPRDQINKEINDFYGNQINELASNDLNLPKEAIFPKNACLKMNKDGETFWSMYETSTIYIQDIGSKNLKIQKIFFMNNKKWLLGPAESLDFKYQVQFTHIDCPSLEMKLTDEEIFELKKQNKLKI